MPTVPLLPGSATTPVLLTLLPVALCSPNCRAQDKLPARTELVPVVQYGRLVDVYGLRSRNGNTVRELYWAGMLSGPTKPNDHKRPYETLPSNPDSLRGRVLINHEIGSPEFLAAVDRLDNGVIRLTPGTSDDPVPRNAAIRITFLPRLELDPATRDAIGLVELQNNSAAVTMRITRCGNTFLVDPVVFGTEALRRQVRNSVGMPASKGDSPNVRLRIDLDKLLVGQPGAGKIQFVFRAANAAEKSPIMVAGMLRDPDPPRILGEMTMYLERVQQLNANTKLLTILRSGIEQTPGQGDILRLYDGSTKSPVAALEILQDAPDPLGEESSRRVRVMVRMVRDLKGADLLERMDPRKLAGCPRKPGRQRDEFLAKRAPRIVLLTAYDPRRGDKPSNFVRFSKASVSNTKRNREDIPPMASCWVRFSKSIDLATLDTLDTIYFADKERAAPGKQRYSHLIPSRLYAEDSAGMSFRLQPPLGFKLTQAMRQQGIQDRRKPFHKRRNRYFLNLVGGKAGIKDRFGLPLTSPLTLGFALDPKAASNHVAYVVARFGAKGK